MMSRTSSAARWRRLIDEQAESDLTGAAFCRERNICRKSFYSWRKRLQAVPEGPRHDDRGFAEVICRSGDPAWSGVKVVLGTPCTISVARGFDPETLRAVLSVVDSDPSA